ncbi:MAG TPA: alanine glycine permease [Planctomycetaceae bacterium]|nr:alanine glycine permease [Blastopirellula sp.]HAY78912.1 alanine glycine permease [Planctomycetaceae bacterium]
MSRQTLALLVVIPLLCLMMASPIVAEEGEAAASNASKISNLVDGWFGVVNGVMAKTLFFQIPLQSVEVEVSEEHPEGKKYVGIPIIVMILALGGIFFTVRYGFINVRLFGHAIQVVRGKFDKPDHHGEISHFQALTSALSATVGLGNIAGVAAAIALGGPGAIFWMWLIAFFGMSMKFSSCSFAQLYRRIGPDGRTLGGPMVYLQEGLAPILSFPIAKVFGVMYAVLCILASFGGGNLFQGNQTAAALIYTFGFERSDLASGVVGLSLAILAGIVIIGGIRRIGEVTSKIVPAMCLIYVGVCLFTIITNIDQAGPLLASIFTEAFTGNAVGGGAAGGIIVVFATGAQRAVFSNEAGVGSAAIAHSAAKTDEPIREGVVAMIGPFIDTIVICTMTALTLLITDVFGGEYSAKIGFGDGAIKTIEAFGTVHWSLKYVLCGAIFVFAYSTIISWSYYGDRAVEYLVGPIGVWPYRVLFVILVALGPFFTLGNVLDFSDYSLLSMAFPNIIGMVLLSGIVAAKTRDYVQRLRSGKMQVIK